MEMKKRFSDERRTEIAAISGEMDVEDLIPEEDCVLTLTNFGYVKRQTLDTYRTQRRGWTRHLRHEPPRRRRCERVVHCKFA